MNKLLKVTISILLVVATVCFTGCKKTDEPNNDGNNGNNGGNGSETPEISTIVSTCEVQYDGTVYVEVVFEDESKMYFEILSPNEVALINGEFFYKDNPSLAYIYRGDVVIPATITHLGTTYSVVSIAKKAFYRNEMVTSVYIPNSVISIQVYRENDNYGDGNRGAFQNCSNLNSIRMSENVQDIGNNSFIGCLCYQESVTITKQIKSIGRNAFSSETVYFNADSCTIAGTSPIAMYAASAFPNMKSIIFGDNVKVLPAYLYDRTSISTIEIPASITVVADHAFYSCYKLESINGLEHVKIIGNSAFSECKSLVSIELSNSIECINESTFYGCMNLSNIDIPNSVVTIGKDAFRVCTNLTEIILPSSIVQIDDFAFDVAYHNIYTSITCMAIYPPILGEEVFGNRNVQMIYVPISSIEAYKTADGWSRYADVIVGIGK